MDASQGMAGILEGVQGAFTAPASWESTLIATTTIFVIAAPVLFVGLSAPGVLSAFVLGLFTFRAFGGQGTIVVFLYFLIVSTRTLCFELLRFGWHPKWSETSHGVWWINVAII